MGKTEEERDEVNIRSFLGKMISERSFKNLQSIIRERKVRCMLSRMMMERANVLMLDETYQPLGFGIDYGFQ
jgi:ATPase subunit of ABC transporter with duplicated ATPase domains